MRTDRSLIQRRLRSGLALLTLLTVATISVASQFGALDWLEHRSTDQRTVATLQSPGDPSIVIIDIDNASFTALTEKLGRWPWTRRVWSELLRYIRPGLPKRILFDVLFTGSEVDADSELADQLTAAGNVVLPFAFVSGQIQTTQPIFTAPLKAAVEATSPIPGVLLTRQNWAVSRPEASLEQAASALGSNLWAPDSDGTTRRLPLVVRYEQQPNASVWLATAQTVLGHAPVHYTGQWFVADPIRLPVDDQGRFTLRWHGDPQTAYRRIPLWEMICSIYPTQCDASVRRHPPEEFRNRIVLIGASAAGSYDVRPTPLSETAPGVFVLATAIDNLLHNDAIRAMAPWPAWIWMALLSALPSVLLLRFRSILIPGAGTLAVAALWTGAAFAAYRLAYDIPMAAPLLGMALSFTTGLLFRYFTVDRELARTRGTLERYVAPELVHHIMDRIEDFSFAGEKKRLTILFSDVRGFTTLSEESDPVELLAQLNEYLEAMTDIIFRHGGIVDKFIGDGIMAHWGAFAPEQPHARLAATAALEMLAGLAELNRKWAAAAKPELDIGIGLNTGTVILGNVGTGKKVDFTAIGDAVNLAARLEGVNKELHTHILLSQATLLELGPSVQVRPLGPIRVKGKSSDIHVYELQGWNPERTDHSS